MLLISPPGNIMLCHENKKLQTKTLNEKCMGEMDIEYKVDD